MCESYIREANYNCSFHIYQVQCWSYAKKTSMCDHVIPFIQRLEIGVLPTATHIHYSKRSLDKATYFTPITWPLCMHIFTGFMLTPLLVVLLFIYIYPQADETLRDKNNEVVPPELAGNYAWCIDILTTYDLTFILFVSSGYIYFPFSFCLTLSVKYSRMDLSYRSLGSIKADSATYHTVSLSSVPYKHDQYNTAQMANPTLPYLQLFVKRHKTFAKEKAKRVHSASYTHMYMSILAQS